MKRDSYATDGTEEYIQNKTTCKVDGSEYKGKYYTKKSGGGYKENENVPRNKEFYILKCDIKKYFYI